MKRLLLVFTAVIFSLTAFSQNNFKFDKIKICVPAKVFIKYAPKTQISVTDSATGKTQILLFSSLNSNNSFKPNVKLKISNNTLYLDQEQNNGLPSKNLTITIKTPNISELDINSVDMIFIDKGFILHSLRINESGAGVIEISGPNIIKKLTVNCNGASVIKIDTKSHAIDSVNINIAGASVFICKTPINNLNAQISGASYCKVNVINNLKADIVGFSILNYTGNPKFKHITSDGLAAITHNN